MKKFYISGNFYATQEYSYHAEVEAENEDEAVKIHTKQLSERKWPEVDAFEVDRAFNLQGKYSIYPDDDSRDNEDLDNVIVEDEEWEGRI